MVGECGCGLCVCIPLCLSACPPAHPFQEIYVLFKAERKRMSEESRLGEVEGAFPF